jgi:tetratricopeptide (TPR) repeat protein
MNMHELRTVAVFTVLLLAIPLSATHAAGGSSAGSRASASEPSRPAKSKIQLGAERYNKGLGYRDKGNALGEQATAAENEKKAARLSKKAVAQYKKATKQYKAAIKYRPTMYEAHSALGYALRKTGKYEASLLAYNNALDINPEYGEAVEYRGEAYLSLNRLDDAKSAYIALFQTDRALAEQLMQAMRAWVKSRRDDPRDLDEVTISDFATWVESRVEISTYLPANHTTGLTW